MDDLTSLQFLKAKDSLMNYFEIGELYRIGSKILLWTYEDGEDDISVRHQIADVLSGTVLMFLGMDVFMYDGHGHVDIKNRFLYGERPVYFLCKPNCCFPNIVKVSDSHV